MYRLVVVLPLLPLSIGDGFRLKDWPLHLTVAPTFVIDAEPAAVAAAISGPLSEQRPVTVTVGGDEGFGHSGRIPVSVIEPSTVLSDLHQRLVDVLVANGAVFDDPEFVGDGYGPHVTITAAARVHQDDSLTLHQAALVDMAPTGQRRLRQVVWTHTLG